jgi:phosphopantothenoylcysteine decarboxylase / phosphopantothenate---cysteine ligase
VAAVADYRPLSSAQHKLKKDGTSLHLELIANPDILAAVAALPGAPFCVGFAAETEALAEHAEAKRRRKNIPLLVGNLAQDTLGAEDAELILFEEAGTQTLPRADKLTQARRLIVHLANRLNN